MIRWNYAERCARQILRKDVAGDSMDDPAHLKLSKRTAKSIEDELKNDTLPRWQAPGRQYLECLIDAYAVAREHRNHFVHGIYATADTHGPYLAQAVLIPPMPNNGKTQLPTLVTAADISPITNHIHHLSLFAREIMIGFDVRGGRALNADGSPVLEQLPALILPLQPCNYLTT
ncbi:hypothetical protein [Undibacterium sp. Xuan67W]|uniref:hypothetical protein n=1 Tax=Undibacterium sp. Xuan67W TaxID=3413057 RepID=UPI003BF1C097